MKQVLITLFSMIKNFFLHIKIHLHVGFGKEEISKVEKDEDVEDVPERK